MCVLCVCVCVCVCVFATRCLQRRLSACRGKENRIVPGVPVKPVYAGVIFTHINQAVSTLSACVSHSRKSTGDECYVHVCDECASYDKLARACKCVLGNTGF